MEVHWLPHVRPLKRVFELRKEGFIIKKRDYDLVKEMVSRELIQILAYIKG